MSLSTVTPASPERVSYDPKYFTQLFDIEDRHFWFVARNHAIASIVNQIVAGPRPGYRMLEVGCGTGNVLRVLEKNCPYATLYGLDLFAEGLAFARRRTSCALVQADLNYPPFSVQFNLVGCFDVLEHIEDDVTVLRTIRQLLCPDGSLVLTVPAGRSLWSYFDEASHHCRRYEVPELSQKLTEAGYRVDYLTPIMACTYPLVWFGRLLAGVTRSDRLSRHESADQLARQELKIVPGVNQLLAWVLLQEMRVVKNRGTLPFGTSLIAVARRVG